MRRRVSLWFDDQGDPFDNASPAKCQNSYTGLERVFKAARTVGIVPATPWKLTN
jgi:hypothetical protein